MKIIALIHWLLSNGSIEYNNFKNKKYKNWFQFRHGFFNDTIKIDEINKKNYKNFLSNRIYTKGHPWNKCFSGIIDNKLFLPYLLYNYQEYLPSTFLFKDKSGFLPIFQGLMNDDWKGKIRLTSPEILPFLKDNKVTIFKHSHSSVGEGFHQVSFINGKWILDLYEIEEAGIISFLDSLDEYIVQEKILQADYSQEINASSVNTIRFQVAWNNRKKSFELIRAFHRFGSNGQLVDNLGKGNGILVYIDPETGICSNEGVLNNNGTKSLLKNTIISHPNTKIQLTDMQIPGYQEIKNKILEISNSISFLRWIGWDVAITNKGFKIIETNSLTTLDTIQQRQGFLEEDWLVDLFNKNT